MNPSCYLPCLTKLLSKTSHDAPKIRLASHENQLTPGPRNHVARTRRSLPPVTVAEPKNRSRSAAMTTSGHATTNKGPGGGGARPVPEVKTTPGDGFSGEKGESVLGRFRRRRRRRRRRGRFGSRGRLAVGAFSFVSPPSGVVH